MPGFVRRGAAVGVATYRMASFKKLKRRLNAAAVKDDPASASILAARGVSVSSGDALADMKRRFASSSHEQSGPGAQRTAQPAAQRNAQQAKPLKAMPTPQGKAQLAEIRRREQATLTEALLEGAKTASAAVERAELADEEREQQGAVLKHAQKESTERIQSLESKYAARQQNLTSALAAVSDWFDGANPGAAIDEEHAREIGALPAAFGAETAPAGDAPAFEPQNELVGKLTLGRERIRSMHGKLVASLECAVQQRDSAETESVAMSASIAQRMEEMQSELAQVLEVHAAY